MRRKKRPSGQTFPHTIAHRGYKADYPENTIAAFKSAIAVGADALETDIHITRDEIIVLSHDGTMQRCFGCKEKIRNCDWSFIKQQRTLQPPHEPMPRLLDLLNLLAQPENDSIWVILDIKPDNDPELVMRLISQALGQVQPSSTPWNQRITFGCWAPSLVPHCQQYLPDHMLVHIGFSIPYARQFLPVPNMAFSMLQQTLMLPRRGPKFMKRLRAEGRALYDWTVDDKHAMIWSIRQELDGVITNEPKQFQQVCDEWEQGKHRRAKTPLKAWIIMIIMNFGISALGPSLRLLFYRLTGAKRPEAANLETAHKA